MTKILDKISKLALHAKSAEATNRAESAAFRRRVRALCKKHGVKMADVHRYSETVARIGTGVIVAPPRKIEQWQALLLGGVTAYKGCRGLVLANGGLSAVGRERPRRGAGKLYKKLEKAVARLADEYVEESSRPAESVLVSVSGYAGYYAAATTAAWTLDRLTIPYDRKEANSA